MTLLYYDPILLSHDTGDHPENAGRLVPVVRHLNFVGLYTSCVQPRWQPCSVERICAVHERGYVEEVREFASRGGGTIEADTVVSEASYQVARMAAGAVCDATERVISGQHRNAFCLVRPPGHHALADRAMGFCLFNSIAIAARVATKELGIQRVLIVDFDVHHGNGTQAMFWEAADVGYFSMHRSPFYPGTGAADEIGAGPGRGTTCNLPLGLGTPRQQQISQFDQAVKAFAAHIKPQLVLVSAGFDAHQADPVGSLGLESEDFAAITRSLLELADRYAEGRLVSVLEGGYNPHALAECVEIHLEALVDAS